MSETDGSTRQPERCEATNLDADTRRLLAMPTRILPPTAKLAWVILWDWAGKRPNHIVFTFRDLAMAIGADPRSALDWIRRLRDAGLVDVVDRDRRRGTISLYIYHPADIDERRDPLDHQLRLPLRVAPGVVRTDPGARIPGNTGQNEIAPGPVRTDPGATIASPTLYPRARTVDDEVEDEDESTDEVLSEEISAKASRPISEAEAAAAEEALRDVERRWKNARLPLQKDVDQLEEDRSIIRRSHVLLQRGLLPEVVFAEAVERPLVRREHRRRVKTPAAQLTKRLFQYPNFGRLLGALREPAVSRPPGPSQNEPTAVDGAEDTSWWRDAMEDPRVSHLRPRVKAIAPDPPQQPE